MGDILLRSHIDAVRIAPTWIILVGKVENLAPRLLANRLIHEVRKLSHALLTTKQHFHTLMSYLLMEDGSLGIIAILTVRQIHVNAMSLRVVPSFGSLLYLRAIFLRHIIQRRINCSLSTTQLVGCIHHRISNFSLIFD